MNADVLRKTLTAAGYQVLRGDEVGDPAGRGWTELGDIDGYGHEHGWKVAHHLAGELRLLAGRIAALIEAGWKRVTVVTDHGFLMLPGGLPKAELPEHLTETRKGRCARLKELSSTDQLTVPWRWDSQVRFALAPGICCYEAGKEYEHGGLSPQECVVPVLTVSRSAAGAGETAVIDSIGWRGLRCVVKVDGAHEGLRVDLRAKAGDPSSSLTVPKPLDAEGAASLPVADDDRLGEVTLVVLLAEDGRLLGQLATVVGGEG